MKFATNKTFPHPVLSEYSDDYIGRGFQAAFKFNVDADTHVPTLDVRCDLSDDSLIGLTQSGRATFVVEIYCPKTFLRRVETSHDARFQVRFAKGDLHENVVLNAFLVCSADVSQFNSPNFNLEFGDEASFNLMPGDVLAVQDPHQFWWDVEQVRPIGTVFQLVESDIPQPGTFLVSWDEDKIQIMMREKENARFQIAREVRDKKPTLLMSVYFPTLLETLRTMAESNGEYDEKKWFQAIQHKLGEKSLELSPDSDFLNIAQALLGMPLNGILPSAGE